MKLFSWISILLSANPMDRRFRFIDLYLAPFSSKQFLHKHSSYNPHLKIQMFLLKMIPYLCKFGNLYSLTCVTECTSTIFIRIIMMILVCSTFSKKQFSYSWRNSMLIEKKRNYIKKKTRSSAVEDVRINEWK